MYNNEIPHIERATFGIEKMEKKVDIRGNIDFGKGRIAEIIGRVYDEKKCSPVVTTFMGGQREHKVIRRWKRRN
jgi:hypothetical protein